MEIFSFNRRDIFIQLLIISEKYTMVFLWSLGNRTFTYSKSANNSAFEDLS